MEPILQHALFFEVNHTGTQAAAAAALAVGVHDGPDRFTAALGVCLPCVRYSEDRRRELLAALKPAADAVESAWRTANSA